jgi:hypothetical protein
MMKVLMGKMDKLSTKMNNLIFLVKKMRLKGLLDEHFFPLDENVAENSDDDEDNDVVNHGRKSYTHQNPLYETRPKTGFGGRFQSNYDFSQGINFNDHNGLYHNLGSIKLKIPAFQGKNDAKAYLD